MIRRPPRSTPLYSSAASDVYKRQVDTAWLKKLLKWIASAQGMNEKFIKKELQFWVEEYNPQHQSDFEATPDLTVEQVTLH